MSWLSMVFLSGILLCSSVKPVIGQGDILSPQFKHILELSLSKGSSETAHGATISSLRMITDHIALGPLIGYNYYNTRFDESMLNIGIRNEYMFMRKEDNYVFASIDVGIGHPFYRGKREWRDSPFFGQNFVLPALGIAFGLRDHSELLFKAGYLYQTLTVESIPESTNNLKLRYKRWHFTFGVSF